MYSPAVQQQIKEGRANFIAMAITYFLGAFNDNFFKQSALLLAITVGLNHIQSSATMLFSLPFLLFSAYAGWFADHFSKGHVVVCAKILEFCAMIFGAYGILTLNWNCVLVMVFIMSSQSTLFGPAINGSIPELYPPEYVTTANAILKLVTTIAILAGIALAGIALDQQWFETGIPFGRVLVAFVVVWVAGVGVIASFGVVKRKPSATKASFPWLGPLQSLSGLWHLRKDPILLTCVLGDAFFYFTSSLVVLVLNVFGLVQLELSTTTTSLLAVSLMLGVCLGSFMAAKIASGQNWPRLMGPAVFLMALGLMATTITTLINGFTGLVTLFTSLAIAGFGGGLFLIPIASFIQVRPRAQEKGKVIAIANFTAFSGIFLSGSVFMWLTALFSPSQCLFLIGLVSMGWAGIFYWCFAKFNNLSSHI